MKLLAIAVCVAGFVFVAAQVKQEVIYQNGTHPTVRYWYYELHPHAFDCKSDPYSCKECPVGKSDRVITLKHGHYRDVPAEINVFSACSEINMLVPEAGFDVDDDQFLCERSPQDGFVMLDGKKYSCAQDDKLSDKQNLGTLKPGETKTLEVPIH